MKRVRKKTLPSERMWKFIEKGQHEDDCWKWKGGKNNIGYPMIKSTIARKMVLATKVMGDYIGLEGPEIQHTCNSYDCLNPKHLISGNKRTRIDRNIERGIYHSPAVKQKNRFVNCPHCGKRAWYPTLKRHHKQCFTCDEV